MNVKEIAKFLKLSYLYHNYEQDLLESMNLGISADEFVRSILEKEVMLRMENGRLSRIRSANFPYKKYLSDLEIPKLPINARERFNELNSLDFIRNSQNIIMCGNPGTGKTHLAIGLGIEAAMAGFKVKYYNVPTLINRLKELKNSRNLLSIQRQFESVDLMILDELGYISFDKEGGELLFTHLSLRTEQKSTIITTNLTFDKWQDIFGDPIMAAALIDRLTYKSFVVNMTGNSFRLT